MLFVSILQLIAFGFLSASLVLDELMVSYHHDKKCNIKLNVDGFPVNKTITVDNLVVEWGYTSVKGVWNDKQSESDFGTIDYTQTYDNLYDSDCKSHPTIAPTTKPPTVKPTSKPTPKPTQQPSKSNIDNTDNKDSIDSIDSIVSKLTTLSKLANANNTNNINNINNINNVNNVNNVNNIDQSVTNTSIVIPTKSPTRRPTESPTMGPSAAPTYLPTVTLDPLTPAPTTPPTTSLQTACDDLQVVIITGETYFGLIIGGLSLVFLSIVASILITCQLATIKYRRTIRQFVIVLNIIAFMVLLLAFALWIGFFSNNINDVLQTSQNQFQYCVLGEPNMGLSVIFLIVSWVLIGFVSIIACYCGNRPHRWYEMLRRVRHGIDMNSEDGVLATLNGSNMNGNIMNNENYDDFEIDNRYINDPKTLGIYPSNIDNLPIDSMQIYEETEHTQTQTQTFQESSTRNENNLMNGNINDDNIVYGQPIERQYGRPPQSSSLHNNGSIDGNSSKNGSMAGVANYDYEFQSSAYGRSTRQRKRAGYKKGMMDEVHPQYSPLLN